MGLPQQKRTQRRRREDKTYTGERSVSSVRTFLEGSMLLVGSSPTDKTVMLKDKDGGAVAKTNDKCTKQSRKWSAEKEQ